MTEEEIKKIEDHLMLQYVTQPLELEDLISKVAATVAGRLLYAPNRTASFEFMGDVFVARCKEFSGHGKKQIYFVISNETTREMAGNKYIPFTLSCDVDNNFSVIDNYRAAIEGFLRHLLNRDKVEEIQ